MKKDRYGQFKGEWTEFDYELLNILEEVCRDVDADKTLRAYMTDIKELIRSVV